ncbi:glycoside hydrolase domain-containing protein [Lactiplantibacillus plantarum]|uniref:glycoside hydrolase domain-containing protein n=1 Tax=Lactiplantibacillus plantarum TaxID=1590 RepID=UPI002B4BF97C|nr:glycoside hydrolase domain-containing protein [Lactiplantibacillus plantarum]WRM30713.1 glycoside hydrolase domain-containing protein [Lactiplantibacillus plantarum]
MADQLVLDTQQWLNSTYGDVDGFGSVPENGLTGWDTIYGLTRGLQHELGITDLVDNFGPTTAKLFDEIADDIVPGYSGNITYIIQGGFWCKGIDPAAFDGKFTSDTASAVTTMKEYAGLSDTSGTLDSQFMAALLNMSAFTLVANGYEKIRTMQQQLNHDYLAYTGILPCDGVYQRDTNTALIYALQAEEGLDTDTASGTYGLMTQELTPTVSTGDDNNFVRILQWGLYVNNQAYTGAFDGSYTLDVSSSVATFESDMALPETSGVSAGLDVFMSLLTSAGNPDRDAVACDTSHQIDANEAAALNSAGYKYVGRYLTGTAGTGSSEVDKNLTTSEISILTNAGLKIFPIYQDGASDDEDYFTQTKGSSDGRKAGLAAMQLGFPDDTIIYFAVDVDIQDGDIAGTVEPYFTGVASGINSFGFKVGIYATRNVANTIITDGLADKAFVSDMSTGFSGNLGFPMPSEWSFDQFNEVAFDDFYIDKVASNSSRSTAVDDFSAGSSVGGSDDLAKINEIIQNLSETDSIFSFVKDITIEATSKTYKVETPAVDLSLTVDLEGNISDDDGDTSINYNINDGSVHLALDDEISQIIAENTAGFTDTTVTASLDGIASVIKDGDIKTGMSVKATGTSITFKVDSTFEHESTNGKTYEIAYEITLVAEFHSIISPLPAWVTAVQADEHNTSVEDAKANAPEITTVLLRVGTAAVVALAITGLIMTATFLPSIIPGLITLAAA